MTRLYLVGAILQFGLLIYCLIDCIRTDKFVIQHLPKYAWMALILFFPLVGGISWILIGRPRLRPRPRPRVIGPDDDPDFLDGLGKK
ncbi:MAG: PLDc N-terminal domain-containing protein [Angustibacter sp.]